MKTRRRVRFHRFSGVRYEVETLDPIHGLCQSPKQENPAIYILDKLDTLSGLETAIHEGLHACKWSASEEKVSDTAYDISRFLWRLGYRLQEGE